MFARLFLVFYLHNNYYVHLNVTDLRQSVRSTFEGGKDSLQ